jgi:ectoine hydroxylase-related dioxygenase (phytanoyl-CoA dioxygenase family)
MEPRIEHYDLEKFDFVAALGRIFDEVDLTALGSDAQYARLTRATDQSTDYHRMFYAAFESELSTLFRAFVADFVPSVLGTTEFCFQRSPTFRVHLPDNIAVGEFHVDGDYNHQDGEVNFWVPLTPVWGSNSLWIEETLGGRDYQPVVLKPGELLVFDAVNWRHGNMTNTTGSTRVSFDFRCVPLKSYVPSGLRTVSAGRTLNIGDYFDVLEP